MIIFNERSGFVWFFPDVLSRSPPDDFCGYFGIGPCAQAIVAVATGESGWFAGLGNARAERLCFRRFCGFPLGEETPDETSFARFRTGHRAGGRYGKLFAEGNRQLEGKGLMAKAGTLVDPAIIETRATPLELKRARWTLMWASRKSTARAILARSSTPASTKARIDPLGGDDLIGYARQPRFQSADNGRGGQGLRHRQGPLSWRSARRCRSSSFRRSVQYAPGVELDVGKQRESVQRAPSDTQRA